MFTTSSILESDKLDSNKLLSNEKLDLDELSFDIFNLDKLVSKELDSDELVSDKVDLDEILSKELTKFEHDEIVGLSKINLSVRKIAKVLLKAKSTVQDIINKYRKCGLITAAPQSGRPHILTSRNTRILTKMVKKNKQTSLEELTEDFNNSLQISVSSKIVSRKLHKEGYYG
ncbi:aminoacyl tRNA synthase complex-interacting multifunctional protein 1-like [Rhizophagus clarus]|uniref:Aminoacyl tRNA synthase complex-interacting multifunctional protein 1-like n=1 Tax=Rhizophagus clarus TaxID=94130 RepID=A0A8H3KWN8_9GLOM|nr:aminoacyl tRNA synthase complex-interacting multifunctional protein 1-like [Rhizophagus clarus]